MNVWVKVHEQGFKLFDVFPNALNLISQPTIWLQYVPGDVILTIIVISDLYQWKFKDMTLNI